MSKRPEIGPVMRELADADRAFQRLAKSHPQGEAHAAAVARLARATAAAVNLAHYLYPKESAPLAPARVVVPGTNKTFGELLASRRAESSAIEAQRLFRGKPVTSS